MYFLWASRFFVQAQSGFSCVNSTQYTLSSEVDLIVVAMTIIIIIIILSLWTMMKRVKFEDILVRRSVK